MAGATIIACQTDVTQHPAAFCVTSSGWLRSVTESSDFRQRFLGAVSEGMFFPQSASAFPAEGKTGGGGGCAARVRWQHRLMPVRMLHISKSAATFQPDLDSE